MAFPAHLHDEVPVSAHRFELEALGQQSLFFSQNPEPAAPVKDVPDDSDFPHFKPPSKPLGKEAAARNDD